MTKAAKYCVQATPDGACALMRCFATCLLLSLLLGCSHPPSVIWDFETGADGKGTINGKVWLLIDGQRHLVQDRPLMDNYQVLKRSDYARNNIPGDAVSACTAVGPGGSEVMYVKVDAERVMVFRRRVGEAVPGVPPYLLFKTIPRNGSRSALCPGAERRLCALEPDEHRRELVGLVGQRGEHTDGNRFG